MTLQLLTPLLLLMGSATASPRLKVNLSNIELPMDQHGIRLLTGEASVLAHGERFYFYFNNWGPCPGAFP